MTSREFVRIAASIVITYMAGALIVALVYVHTAPIIASNEAKKKVLAESSAAQLAIVNKFIPSVTAVKKAGTWSIHEHSADYFQLLNAQGPAGYMIYSFGKGYSSLINVAITVDTKLNIQGIIIINQAETPGLGTRVEEPEFTRQFAGKCIDNCKVVTNESAGFIQGITAATISSRAVTEDAVRNALVLLGTLDKNR